MSFSPADMRAAAKLAALDDFFVRPVVILSAPRSGSTLLYELLTRGRNTWSIGGESHVIIEELGGLDPVDGRVRSNRLTEAEVDPETLELVRAGFIIGARDSVGMRYLDRPSSARPSSIRFIEKTPKNMLRVPFMRAIFPNARFVLLVRDPREALSSMIEAWESGRFVTYEKLPGLVRPWSMLLPDGYEALSGRSLEECVAFQWAEANRVALGDLKALPCSAWCVVSYADLTRDPASVVRRIAAHAELDLDDVVQLATSQELPVSTHTLSRPQPGKWQRHAERLQPVLEPLRPLYRELQLLVDKVC